MINPGTNVLVIKYGKIFGHDCIEEHKRVLDEKTFCWFGKLGTPPGKKKLMDLFPEGKGLLILYCQGNGYLCNFDMVQNDKPDEGFPLYYVNWLFKRNLFPSIYFRLVSIDSIEIEELSKLETLSSGQLLVETAHRSMASFFYTIYPDPEKPIIPSKKKEKVKHQKEEDVSTVKNNKECKYQIDGMCGLKNFVNYKYECMNPKYCVKQKACKA